MNVIFEQLKFNSIKPLPKVWNISVEITQRIIEQNEANPQRQKDFYIIKEKHQNLKRLSDKENIQNIVQENQQEINKLEKSVNDLKEQLQEINKKSQEIQSKIEESRQKKSESEKKNDMLTTKIDDINKQIENIEQSILNLNSKIGEQDNTIESLNYIIKAEQKMFRIIAQVKNKCKKVHFPQDNKEKITPGSSLTKWESDVQFSSKPTLRANDVRKRSKSFSGSTNPIPKMDLNANIPPILLESGITMQKGCITTIAFSNNGKYYACGSETKIFYLFSSGNCIPTASQKTYKSVISLDFNSSDNLLLVACFDTIQLFDFEHFNIQARPDKPKIEKIFRAEFISNDSFVVCSENYAIRFYKVGKKGPKLKASLIPRFLSTASWICHASGYHEFAAGYQTGIIRIWDPHSCQVIFENSVHKCPVIQILYHGSTFVSLSQDGCVAFSNIISHVIERKVYLKGCNLHDKSRMAISGNSILIGGDDGLIYEFSIIDGKHVSTWPSFHTSPITALSSNKYYVISGDKSGKIKIWNVQTNK